MSVFHYTGGKLRSNPYKQNRSGVLPGFSILFSLRYYKLINHFGNLSHCLLARFLILQIF